VAQRGQKGRGKKPPPAKALPKCNRNALMAFLSEVQNQVSFALMAHDNLMKEAKSERHDSMVIRFLIQAFLGCSAMVAKLLWPSYRKGEQYLADRGERLRALLNAKEEDFKPVRQVRNAFEHFDCRLEEWAATVKSGHFIDGNVNPHLALGPDRHKIWLRNLRSIDPPAIIFRNKECLIDPLIAALKEAAQRAATAQNTLEQQGRAEAAGKRT
jgi:hypothetical protein